MSLGELIKLISDLGLPIVCAGVVIYLFIKITTQQQKWLSSYFEENLNKGSRHPSSEDVEVLEVINDKIYQEIRGVLNALGADRSFVYLYHNGGVSSSGLYFQKMSCICEVVSQGILPVSSEKQMLYRASYARLCDSLKSKGEHLVPDTKSLQGRDDYLYYMLSSRHARSSYFKALKDSQGNVIGFIGIDYCSLNQDVSCKQITDLLSIVSLKISSLVDIRDEVKEM